MYDIKAARKEPFAPCVPSWALLGKCDGVLRARLHPNENYPFAVRLTWPRGSGGMSEFDPFAVTPLCARLCVRCVLRVSNSVSSAMHGKEGRWTENCFMLRF